jgi:23S rRNA (cytosine1962-C5)-methyltransferase
MVENQFSLPTIADGEDKSSPLKNRIRKNYRHARKWAKRTITNCFRIYDRDIKEYPLVIDYYDGRFSVQYFTSSRDSDDPPPDLVDITEEAICSIFETSNDSIHWRTRVKRKRTEQYEKIDEGKEFFIVLEYGVKFKINLRNYLDTGLFLDHRETRRLVASMSEGKRVLNLFAYTCSFSVHAAAAGAAYTKSVDMSNTYIAWGKDNFILNSIPLKNHPLIREDCMKFLDDEIQSREKYDIVIIDPPTVSRSKKMDEMFDVQNDYTILIKKSLKLLNEGGVIFFSTNSRKFDFEDSYFNQCSIQEITLKTIPFDFHNKKIHRCWKISLSTRKN